jgi:hypothetical protein
VPDALTTYIRGLLEASAQSSALAESEAARRAREEVDQFAQRAIPLIDRLKRIIGALPEAERNTPRPLEFFAERLRGRQRLTPHRGELAAALRALGWKRSRCWRDAEGGFRAYWYPPILA